MITVYIHENEVKIEDSFNVKQLLQHLGSPTEGIAVAINNKVVSKKDWAVQKFNPQDKVLIIKATQGG